MSEIDMAKDLATAVDIALRSARNAASAMIAKIALPLSRHIARTYYPERIRP